MSEPREIRRTFGTPDMAFGALETGTYSGNAATVRGLNGEPLFLSPEQIAELQAAFEAEFAKNPPKSVLLPTGMTYLAPVTNPDPTADVNVFDQSSPVIWRLCNAKNQLIELITIPREWVTYHLPAADFPLGYYRVVNNFDRGDWTAKLGATFNLDLRTTVRFGSAAHMEAQAFIDSHTGAPVEPDEPHIREAP
jgi:hypothetical protein